MAAKMPLILEITTAINPLTLDAQQSVTCSYSCNETMREFLRQIPDKVWKTFCLATTFLTPDGRCIFTEEQICKATGFTRTQVKKRLEELIEWAANTKHALQITKTENEPVTYELLLFQGKAPDAPRLIEPEDRPSNCEYKANEKAGPPTAQELIIELTKQLHSINGKRQIIPTLQEKLIVVRV